MPFGKINQHKSINKNKKLFKKKFFNIFFLFFKIFLIIIFLLSIVFVISAFFNFKIKNITIERGDFRINAESIGNEISYLIGKNIFSFRKDILKNDILNKFPEINNVEIKRVLPDKLVIYSATYPVAFRWRCVWKNDYKKDFFVNFNGKITMPNFDEENAFLITEDLQHMEKNICESINSKSSILPSKRVIDILKGKNLLEPILDNLIVEAFYLRDAQEIHFITKDKTAIWIDFVEDDFTEDLLNKQLEKLKLGIAEDITLKSPIKHIDLRVRNKIFYE